MTKGTSASTFKYKERDVSAVTKRATQTSGMYDSIISSNFQTWKPKEGTNIVRILPATWDEAEHYGMDIFKHNNIGPENAQYLCLFKMKGEECPACNERRSLEADGLSDDAILLKVQKQVLVWIIDRSDEASGPQLWSMGWTVDKDINVLSVNKRTGRVLLVDHPDEGYDIEFIREGTQLKTRYVGVQVAREQSPISDDEALQKRWLKFVMENPLPETLNYFDAAYISGIMMGKKKEEPKDEPKSVRATRSLRDEADTEEAPVAKKKKPATVDEVEEPEVEETPKASKLKVVEKLTPVEDDDDVVEDDEDDVPDEEPEPVVPKRSGREALDRLRTRR